MMETSESLSKRLVEAKAKRVRFAPEVEEPQSSYTPYKRVKKEYNFESLRKSVVRLLARDQFEEVKNYLQLYSISKIEEFYLKCGKGIIEDSLLYSDTSAVFAFLLEAIPYEIVVGILKENNADLIIRYIRVYSLVEEKGKGLSSIEKEGFSEKIKILLALDEKEISNTIKTTLSQADISHNIKELWHGSKTGIFALQMA